MKAFVLVMASAVALASCASSSGPKVSYVKKSKSQSSEYFAESEYGVKASPRVVNVASAIGLPGMKAKRLPRGGGRAQVGKPYKVKGKWYYPKEEPGYQASGTASWYGDAFHGRLTANGEIYDMNHLSAAHPTMPLPSYARVTNQKNGNSVIVRVNDRGPYAHNRLIDLSKRAAQLLDYTQTGTAQVVVEYVGPARVDGQDDQYLVASYQPGDGTPVAADRPVMVAMSEQTAITSDVPVAAFSEVSAQANVLVAPPQPIQPIAADMAIMPVSAPVPSNRPDVCVTLEPCDDIAMRGMLNGYADTRIETSNAGAAFKSMDLSADKIIFWKQSTLQERILVGTFAGNSVFRLKTQLKALALVTVETSTDGTADIYVSPRKGTSVDKLLKNIWKQGFRDAFVVR